MVDKESVPAATSARARNTEAVRRHRHRARQVAADLTKEVERLRSENSVLHEALAEMRALRAEIHELSAHLRSQGFIPQHASVAHPVAVPLSAPPALPPPPVVARRAGLQAQAPLPLPHAGWGAGGGAGGADSGTGAPPPPPPPPPPGGHDDDLLESFVQSFFFHSDTCPHSGGRIRELQGGPFKLPPPVGREHDDTQGPQKRSRGG